METYLYTCGYCKKKFIPKRRKVQKFCSNSCRVRHHQEKNSNKVLNGSNTEIETKKPNITKVDKISAAGIGNAALGTALTDTLKSLLTSEDSKSATKGDIKRIEDRLQRYHKVQNMIPDNNGRYPYFDMQTKKIIYY